MTNKTSNLSMKKNTETIVLNKEYQVTLAELKKQIRESQLKAAVSVNKELICLYWTIGKTIVKKQEDSA